MSRWLKALPLALALAALSSLAASCGSSSGTTQVRFVNALQDTTQYGAGFDVEFNGTREFSNVQFFGYLPSSGYLNVASGNSTITGFETGSIVNQIFNANVSLNAGSQYTIVATGFATNISKVVILSIPDNNLAPANNKVEFRAINASPSGPPTVDIYILPIGTTGSLTPPATMANLAYRSVSSYVTLPYNPNSANGANYTMFVTAAGTTTPILLTQSLSAGTSSTGAIRTVVLTDQENIDQLNQLAIVLNDFH